MCVLLFAFDAQVMSLVIAHLVEGELMQLRPAGRHAPLDFDYYMRKVTHGSHETVLRRWLAVIIARRRSTKLLA